MSILDNIMFDLFAAPFDSQAETVFAPTMGEIGVELEQRMEEMKERREKREQEAQKLALQQQRAALNKQLEEQVLDYLENSEETLLGHSIQNDFNHKSNAETLVRIYGEMDREFQHIVHSTGDAYKIFQLYPKSLTELSVKPADSQMDKIVFNGFLAEKKGKYWKVTAHEDADKSSIVFELFNIVNINIGIPKKDIPTTMYKNIKNSPFSLKLPVVVEETKFVPFKDNLFRQTLVALKGLEWYQTKTEEQLKLLESVVQYIE